MLDTDDTETPSGTADGTPAEGATPEGTTTGTPAPAKKTPRKRAPRKATAAAGPPPADPAGGADAADAAPGATDAAEAPAAPAPRKRSPRKAAAKKAQPQVETAATAADQPLTVDVPGEPVADAADVPTGLPADGAAETPLDVPAAPAAPAKAARRTRKRAAAPAGPAPETTVPDVEVGAVALAEGPTVPAEDAADQPPAAPAKAARKRASRKTAAAKAAAEAAEAAETAETAETAAAPADPAADPEAAAVAASEGPTTAEAPAPAAPGVLFMAPSAEALAAATPTGDDDAEDDDTTDETVEEADPDDVREAAIEQASGARRRRRRGHRGRGGGQTRDDAGDDTETADDAEDGDAGGDADTETTEAAAEDEQAETGSGTSRRRRRRRRSGSSDDDATSDDPPNTVTHVREPKKKDPEDDGVKGVKGSTRLEAKRQRRRDGRDTSRRRAPILTEAEFLARREAVDRVMAVRQQGDRTQIAVLEDDILVEHYVTRASATSYVGNVYLGRVQNVLPSMEAAFIDIGKGRNGVLYAGEVNWDAAGLEGKSRAIEQAMKSGDSVLVQVTKDPIGHKGARLTSQISLPGRFLVYVPNGAMTGISRRLPDTERHRLKSILKKIVPEDAGVIVRTAAEGASEEDLTHDVERLQAQWEQIQQQAEQKKNAPVLLHGEPDLAIRVVRDVFNEDFKQLVVQGDEAWTTVSEYVQGVAPDLAERVSRHTADTDLFHDLRVDEQLMKALDRKVWLPSGGSLVIDRTEAMTVIDVNTGKFVGSGGNLEQTVTRNNLEAAEEIVRQLRLRDVGGIVVIDFIDMVLESNRELVLRRLTECLGRDRTKHQVAEVTSLGLVQMTRKRVGEGLLEAFSEPCEHCKGRGVIVHTEPVDEPASGGGAKDADEDAGGKGKRRRRGRGGNGAAEPEPTPTPVDEEQRKAASAAIAAIHRAAAGEKDGGGSAEVDELAADLVQAVLKVDSRGTVERVPAADSAAEPAAAPAEAPEPPAALAAPTDPTPEAPAAPTDPTHEAMVTTAAVELGAPIPDADPAAVVEPAPAPVNGSEPPATDGPLAPPRRPRRRRAASRPAGPPTGH